MREMKDSSIAWVGLVPTSWKTELGKHFMECLNRPVLDEDGVITCFRDGEVTLRSKRREDGFTISLQEIGYQGIEPGDLVIHGMDGFAGSIGISDSRGKATPVLNVLDTEQNKEFMMYSLRSMAYNNVFLALSTGIRVRTCDTSWKKIRSLAYVLPPIKEQEQIAKTINKKITLVNALIANQEAQIEKLKAYKQSLITEVVTKGLDKSMPMKDSGVEWIGDIPEKWNISKVGRFYEIVLGKMLQPTSNGNDTLEKYLCAANVGGNKLSLELIKEMWFTNVEKETYQLQKGDLVVVEGGDIASSAIIDFESNDLYFQNALHRARPRKGYNAFLRYWLMFAKGSGYFEMICNKATIAHFTKEKFCSLPFLVVPENEQLMIVNYLDDKCAKIEALIAKKQQKIEKLNQYKKSLIYEYVTGKKEVV